MIVPPVLLHYYITTQCNCRCSFCDIPGGNTGNDMLFADVRQVHHNLEQAKKLGITFVDFTGGEPLLHPEIEELLRYAKMLHFRTSITTNCLLYPQKANALRGLVDFLHFSLDALDESRHNTGRGANVYSSVMQSIDLARELGESPDLLYTVTDDNIDELESLVEFAHQVGLVLILNPVFIKPILAEQNLRRLEQFHRHPNAYLNKAMLRLRYNGGNTVSKPRCRAVSSTLVISPDNHILLPCYHFMQKKLPAPVSFTDLYADKTWREYLRRQGRFNFCAGCVINCYFDPSFLYKADLYMLESLAAKARYAWYKYIYHKFLYPANQKNRLSAAEIARNINKQRKT